MTLKTVVITGASSGLGAALALEYARPGTLLGLTGRDQPRLAQIADQCRAKGAVVETISLNVTDAHTMTEWILDLDLRHPIDLCIANAGISAGTGGGGESLEQATRIFDVNLNGVLNTIHPVVDKMLLRQSGQIAIISSIAGFRGVPTAPAYSASKAAVRFYGQALGAYLKPRGIDVSVICPGFIRTPMTDVNPFPMPFIMPADQAAIRIKNALARRKTLYVFPWPMAVMARIQNMLPNFILDTIYNRVSGKPST